MPSIDDYLMSAWQQMSPGFDKRSEGIKFPRGFWPDLARLAVTQALAGYSERKLEEAEQFAKRRYDADPVWASHCDLEVTEHQPRRLAQLTRKGKSKQQLADELLGELKL